MIVIIIIIMALLATMAVFGLGVAVGAYGQSNLFVKAIEELDVDEDVKVYILERMISKNKNA